MTKQKKTNLTDYFLRSSSYKKNSYLHLSYREDNILFLNSFLVFCVLC